MAQGWGPVTPSAGGGGWHVCLKAGSREVPESSSSTQLGTLDLDPSGTIPVPHMPVSGTGLQLTTAQQWLFYAGQRSSAVVVPAPSSLWCRSCLSPIARVYCGAALALPGPSVCPSKFWGAMGAAGQVGCKVEDLGS